MTVTDYRFEHSCIVPGTPEQVHEVLLDLEHYGDWWPQIRAVAGVGPDDALVVCRSVLPYDLELRLSAVSRQPDRLEVTIDGPIRGWVRWTLTPAASGTRLDFEQEVTAVDRLFVFGSYVLKPVLNWNHARMMRGAEQGLHQRLRPTSRPG